MLIEFPKGASLYAPETLKTIADVHSMVETQAGVAKFTFHPVDIGISQDFYIGMSVALNELGGLDAHGAVIGGKCLVELRHLSADGR